MPNSSCPSPDLVGRGHNLNINESKEELRSIKNQQQVHKKWAEEKNIPKNSNQIKLNEKKEIMHTIY